MFQFLLTILIVVMGMVNGYLYNEIRFLKKDLAKIERSVQLLETSASSERIEKQALEFIESFQESDSAESQGHGLAETQIVELPEVSEPENKETIEILDGSLKGFLDVIGAKSKQDGQSVMMEFSSESQNLQDLVAQSLGGVVKVAKGVYQVNLGCVNNSGIIKSQIFSLSNEESQKILKNEAEELRLFFSPKVGYVGRACQSPLSSVQILD